MLGPISHPGSPTNPCQALIVTHIPICDGVEKAPFLQCAGGSKQRSGNEEVPFEEVSPSSLHTVGQADENSRNRQKKLEPYPIYHPEAEWQETNNVDDGSLPSNFVTSACRLDK